MAFVLSKVISLITSPLPQTGGLTPTFFYFPWFFLQPPRLLQHLVVGLPSFLFNRWLSNKLCTYSIRASIFSKHAVWFPTVACVVCLLHFRLLRFPLPSVRSVPTATHKGSTLVSSPPSISRYVKGRLFECFPLSMIAFSSCSKLRVALPNVF